MNELTRAIVLCLAALLNRVPAADPRFQAEATALLVTLHERVADVAYSRTSRGEAALERAELALPRDSAIAEAADPDNPAPPLLKELEL